MMVQVKFKKLQYDVVLPEYATPGSACFDIRAYVPLWSSDGMWLLGNALIIPTGLQVEIPEGYCMLIFSRSGHGFNGDVRLANCVGVIDSDYRGEIKVKLRRDQVCSEFVIHHGDRIAQGMIVPAPQSEIVEASYLSSTERGTGGFGSTGKG